jgi:hypothetical protein
MNEAEKKLRLREEQTEMMKKYIIERYERGIQELESDYKKQIKEAKNQHQAKLERERYPKGREASRDRESSGNKGGPDFSFVDQLAPYGVYRGFKPEHDIEPNKKREKIFSSQRKYADDPSRPKMSTFDGKADWRPSHAQFSHIDNRYKWSDKDDEKPEITAPLTPQENP